MVTPPRSGMLDDNLDGATLFGGPPIDPTPAELDHLGGLALALCGGRAHEQAWLKTGEVPRHITAALSMVIGRQRRAYNTVVLGWFRYDPAVLHAENLWASYWRDRGWNERRGDDDEPPGPAESPTEGGVWVEITWDRARLHLLSRESQQPLL